MKTLIILFGVLALPLLAADAPLRDLDKIEAALDTAPNDPMLHYRKCQALFAKGKEQESVDHAVVAMTKFKEAHSTLAWMLLGSITTNGFTIDVHYNMGPKERAEKKDGVVRPYSFRIWTTNAEPQLVRILELEILLLDNCVLWAVTVATATDQPTEQSKQFIIGADISWAQQQEDEGTHFSDKDVQKDLFDILKDYKFNWIRLRIFDDPKAENGYSKHGYCDLNHTQQMARRIKAAGMRFLLDFHYSDTWADPGHQFKPNAWKDLHGGELKKAVQEYTRDVVATLKRQGTPPDMVQIGNEISNGFLWPDGGVWKSKDWDTFCDLLKAGITGAKEADPAVKIMVHLALGGQNAKSRTFVDKMLAHNVPFDIIGQSYYPRWHGTLTDLKENLTDLAGRYRQDIIVVEYAAPHLKEINDIVHDLPKGKGLGTFFWEPTKGGPGGAAVFESDGRTKQGIAVYSELAKRYEKN